MKNRYYVYIVLFLLLVFNSCIRKNNEDKITIEFNLKEQMYDSPFVVLFNSDEVEIVDWDKQIIKLHNELKVNLINFYITCFQGHRSYLTIRYEDSEIYKVSLIAPLVNGKYCSNCPVMYVNRINQEISILEENGTCKIFFDDIDTVVDPSYTEIRNKYKNKIYKHNMFRL